MSGNAAELFTGSRGHSSTDGLSMFIEGILPSQYFGSMGANRDMPEKRLLLTILEDAIRCVGGTSFSVNDHGLGRSPSRKRRLRNEALDWISGGPALVTFDFVCEGLGIDPEWLRQGIRIAPAGTKIERRSPPTVGAPKIGSSYLRRRNHKFGMPRKVKKTIAFQQTFVMGGLAQGESH